MKVLVAFSGTVSDGGLDWTEARMNGFPDSQTAPRFNDEAQIMVVAEKYQTGFDQPLLYAMYVDKTLTGLAAVQTLSRLNRICDGKDGTFVLDFRNDADDIARAFEPWYGRTVAPPTDPNLLYDTRAALDPFGVLRVDEVERVTGLLLTMTTVKDHGRIHAAMQPAIDRFRALDEERPGGLPRRPRPLRAHLRLPGAAGQLRRHQARTGLCLLPGARLASSVAMPASRLDLGREVELTHLRHEVTFEGSVALE